MKKILALCLITLILMIGIAYADETTREDAGLPKDLPDSEWEEFQKNPVDFLQKNPTHVDAFVKLNPEQQLQILNSETASSKTSDYQVLLNRFMLENAGSFPGVTIDMAQQPSGRTFLFYKEGNNYKIRVGQEVGNDIYWQIGANDKISVTNEGLFVNGVLYKGNLDVQDRSDNWINVKGRGGFEISGLKSGDSLNFGSDYITCSGSGKLVGPDGTSLQLTSDYSAQIQFQNDNLDSALIGPGNSLALPASLGGATINPNGEMTINGKSGTNLELVPSASGVTFRGKSAQGNEFSVVFPDGSEAKWKDQEFYRRVGSNIADAQSENTITQGASSRNPFTNTQTRTVGSGSSGGRGLLDDLKEKSNGFKRWQYSLPEKASEAWRRAEENVPESVKKLRYIYWIGSFTWQALGGA
ncbi:hypothetical protein KY330_04690 [Candidatus Woesearchaeota archaeon]|nr:hypothetical protein [Candidatus Woesearchaeota archaeon]